MAQTKTTRHNIVTRCLAAMALVSVYCVGLIGASTVLLTTSSTSAEARGGGRGRGGGGWGRGRGGGFYRGGGRGYGRGYGFYGGPVVVRGGPRCWWNAYGVRVCRYY